MEIPTETFQEWFCRIGRAKVKERSLVAETEEQRGLGHLSLELLPLEVLAWIHHMPDWWRDVAPQWQIVVSMTTGLGNFIPKVTNGTLIIGQLLDARQLVGERWFIAHRTNMPEDWSKSFAKATGEKKPKVTKTKKTKEAAVALTIDADSILDL